MEHSSAYGLQLLICTTCQALSSVFHFCYPASIGEITLESLNNCHLFQEWIVLIVSRSRAENTNASRTLTERTQQYSNEVVVQLDLRKYGFPVCVKIRIVWVKLLGGMTLVRSS